MNSAAHTPFFADKSLWLVVLGVLLPPVGKKLGVEFDVGELAGMVALIVGFVTSSKWKQAVVIKAEAAGAVAAKPVVDTASAVAALK